MFLFAAVVEQLNTTANVTVVGAADTTYLVKRWIPLGTGMLNITVTSNTSSLYFTVRSEGAPTGSYYECYTGSETAVGNNYVFNLACPNARQNAYAYVFIDPSSAFS